MPKRTGDFDSWMLGELADPVIAASYIKATIAENPNALKVALGNVAKAHSMKKVAEEAGMARESLYTSLSEAGNPTLTNLNAILKAVGLKIEIVPDSEESSVQEPTPGIAVADNPPADDVSGEVGTIYPHFDADHLSGVILIGSQPSSGIVGLGFGIQSGSGAEIPSLLGGSVHCCAETFDISKIFVPPGEPYLKQFTRMASAGTQQKAN
jgi:probable addiction module antidote protein